MRNTTKSSATESPTVHTHHHHETAANTLYRIIIILVAVILVMSAIISNNWSFSSSNYLNDVHPKTDSDPPSQLQQEAVEAMIVHMDILKQDIHKMLGALMEQVGALTVISQQGPNRLRGSFDAATRLLDDENDSSSTMVATHNPSFESKKNALHLPTQTDHSENIPSTNDHGTPTFDSNIISEALAKSQEPQPRILHVVWGRPLPTDKGYNGKDRVLDNSSFTGCCDGLVELALRSYVKSLPNDFDIYLWSMGGWDSSGFLKSVGLNGMNIVLKDFDPNVELADDLNLVKVYGQLTSVVTRSDFVRYTIMRNYGGSYIDLDGILVRGLPYDGVPRLNLSPTVAVDGHLTCAGGGYFRLPGTCILSNGIFVGFPVNHTIFRTILGEISVTERTCGGTNFFCYGPNWISQTLLHHGISNIAEIGIRVEPILRNNGDYKSIDSVLVVLSELCNRFNMTAPDAAV
ncbi:hypothetical protein HJC23_004659 [Cyclotella cryptica]|uniref:Uncharacterized protein n=1 Tax=Cyclotella cryptica TaxID=29204 RepID=A0ABD3PKB5_9STRA